MNYKLCVLLAAAVMGGCMCGKDLPHTLPEEQGLKSERVIELLDSLTSIEQAELHSVVVARHGNVVAEAYIAPFDRCDQHELFSVSKTFTAAAVGLAMADNLLRLDDRLGAILPEELPDSVSPWLADVTVRDLLTMTSGIKVDWALRGKVDHWAKAMLAAPMVAEPGEKFSYDSMSSYLLSAIVQKVTGRRMADYLDERVLTPLGIRDYAWDVSPDGVNAGGWGLWMRPCDMAKFGQLLLDRGMWDGERILEEAWVEEMMRKHEGPSGDAGYCFHMWSCSHGSAAKADGAWGQYIIVMPEEDMVAVITECQQGVGGRVQGLVWDILTAELSDAPLEAGKAARNLSTKLKGYAHEFPGGKARGKGEFAGRSIRLDKNPMGWKSIVVETGRDGLTLRATADDGREDVYACGFRRWIKSTLTTNPPDERSDTYNRFSGHTTPFYADAAYGWKGDCLDVKIHYTNWYSSLALTIKPGGVDGEVEVIFKLNYMGKPVGVRGWF